MDWLCRNDFFEYDKDRIVVGFGYYFVVEYVVMS